MGMQYDKQHAVTLLATAALNAYRFAGFDGAPATNAGAGHDAQGVTESPAAIGEAISVITAYSAPVEAGEAIAKWDYVKPAADGSGKAVVGTATECCGRALEAATAAGQIIEVRIMQHRHA